MIRDCCTLLYFTSKMTLPKNPKCHLISWCRNFVETLRKHAFPQNFHTRKLGEITVFYSVQSLIVFVNMMLCATWT